MPFDQQGTAQGDLFDRSTGRGVREGTNVGRAWWFKEGALHYREGLYIGPALNEENRKKVPKLKT
jgi:hypothetical protein